MSDLDTAADRIAAAPRAWAVKTEDRPISVHSSYNTKEWAEKEARLRPGSRVVQVALVEVEGEG
jgi:hypothetical protein